MRILKPACKRKEGGKVRRASFINLIQGLEVGEVENGLIPR